MKALTIVKLSLAGAGMVLFGVGIRFDNPAVRFAGIGCVAGAWLLRFAKDRGDG